MTRDEMVLRMGFYAGRALRDLGDGSYYERWHGRAQELTEEEYEQTVSEILARLVAEGKIRPDEYPFEDRR